MVLGTEAGPFTRAEGVLNRRASLQLLDEYFLSSSLVLLICFEIFYFTVKLHNLAISASLISWLQ